VAEVFTGAAGKYVSLKDTISGFTTIQPLHLSVQRLLLAMGRLNHLLAHIPLGLK
jgi:F0F1-type ATP synthase beta subunit